MAETCKHKTVADNSDFFVTETIESADDLFTKLFPELFKMKREGWVFRGHSSSNYQLIPSALRDSPDAINNIQTIGSFCIQDHNYKLNEYFQFQHEYQAIRNFYKLANSRGIKVPHSAPLMKSNAIIFDQVGAMRSSLPTYKDDKITWIPEDLLEAAALAQHYGLPTRLLDWTRNPYIAGFFCIDGNENTPKDSNFMEIWCLNLEIILQVNENPHFLESKLNFEAQDKSDNPNVNFNPRNFWDNALIVAPTSQYENPNINAQEGILTSWQTRIPFFPDHPDSKKEVTRTPLCCLIEQHYKDNVNTIFKNHKNKPLIKSFKIRTELKDHLLIGLEDRDYDISKIYPGLEGVANEIKKRAKLFEVYRKNHLKIL